MAGVGVEPTIVTLTRRDGLTVGVARECVPGDARLQQRVTMAVAYDRPKALRAEHNGIAAPSGGELLYANVTDAVDGVALHIGRRWVATRSHQTACVRWTPARVVDAVDHRHVAACVTRRCHSDTVACGWIEAWCCGTTGVTGGGCTERTRVTTVADTAG